MPGGVLPSEAPFDLFCVCGASTEHFATYLGVEVAPGDVDHNFNDPVKGTYVLRSDDATRAGLYVDISLPATVSLEVIFESNELPADLSTTVKHVYAGLYDDTLACIGMYFSQAGLAYGGAYDDAPLLIPGSEGKVLPGETYVTRMVLDHERQAFYFYLSTLQEAQTVGLRLLYVLPLLDTLHVPSHAEGVYFSALGTSESPSKLEIHAACLSSQALVTNLPPVADPGPDQTVRGLGAIRLDGGRSKDPEGTPLSYVWRVSGLPDGSTYLSSGVDGTTLADVSGFVGKLYSENAAAGPEAFSFVPGDILLFQNVKATLVTTGVDGDGAFFEVSESVLPASLSDQGYQIIRQDGLQDPEQQVATYIPDVVGVHRFDLQVTDAAVSSPWASVVVNALSREQARGIIPDTSFLWEYMSDTWRLLEDPERIESMWSGMYQVMGAELVRLWQAGASKSLKDIPRQVQRRWLNYDLLLREPYPEPTRVTGRWSGVRSSSLANSGLSTEGLSLVLSVPGRESLIEVTMPTGGTVPSRFAQLLRIELQKQDAQFVVQSFPRTSSTSEVHINAPFPFLLVAGTDLTGFTIGQENLPLRGVNAVRVDANTLLLDQPLRGCGLQPDDLIAISAASTPAVVRVRSVQNVAGDTHHSQRIKTLDPVPADAAGGWEMLLSCTSPHTRMADSRVAYRDQAILEIGETCRRCFVAAAPSALPFTVGVPFDDDIVEALGPAGRTIEFWGVYRKKYLPVSKKVTSIPTLQVNPWGLEEEAVLRENTDYTIEEDGAGKYLQFRTNLFETESVQRMVPRLWAEETYLDNGDVIEGNFGLSVGFPQERVRNELTDVDYLSAVRGLWFAFARGPRVRNLRVASQILLGLPFAEERSTILEIDLLYSPTRARLLLQDKELTTNIRSYTYPRELTLEVNPATGKEYKVGDSVDAFAPLVSGVAILDWVNDPSWADPFISQGVMYSLERLHTFLVRVDLEAFSLTALSFVDEFLRRVKPARTKPLFLVRMQDLDADTIDVTDEISYRGTLELFDSPYVLPISGPLDDDPNVSDHEGSAGMLDEPDPSPTDGVNTPASSLYTGRYQTAFDTDIDPSTAISTTGTDAKTNAWGVDVNLLAPESFIHSVLSIDYDGVAAMTVFEDIADAASQPLFSGEVLVYGTSWLPSFRAAGLRLKGPTAPAATLDITYAQVRLFGRAPAGGRSYVVWIYKNGNVWFSLAAVFTADGEQVFEYGPAPATNPLAGAPYTALTTDDIRAAIHTVGLDVSDQTLKYASVVLGEGVSWDPTDPPLAAGTYFTLRTLLG